MNTKAIGAASEVICRAMAKNTVVPATIALALDASGLLNTVDAAEELVRLRARVAELEALEPARHQTCRECGAGYDYGQPCSNCAFRVEMAAALASRPVRRVPLDHDLPEVSR